jgi:hypothetical protein
MSDDTTTKEELPLPTLAEMALQADSLGRQVSLLRGQIERLKARERATTSKPKGEKKEG